MTIQKQLDILQQGTGMWNTWRTQQPGITIDLSFANLIRVYLVRANLNKSDLNRANLSFADLRETDLRETNFTRADLRGADLRGADLYRADFSFANLRDTDLSGAYLIETNLNGANLNGANLSFANFIRTNLRDADFSETRTLQTIFGDLDLRTLKGLERIHHEGPSIIGTDTLERSQGDIPDTFLRGIGVSNSLIEYTHSLFRMPIEYYTCFISYSSKDQEFAERLHADLQRNGVRCWFAPKDLKIGDKFRTRIDESIKVYDKLLLVLSDHALASSWVEFEVEAAFAKEDTIKRTVLFPIRLNTSIMKSPTSWAAHIQHTRHIGNFEHWKNHDTYMKAFNRLLSDLKADATKNTH